MFVAGVEAEACDQNDFALQVDADTVKVTRDPAYNSTFYINITVYCVFLQRVRRNLHREVDHDVVNYEKNTNQETDNEEEEEHNVDKHEVKHNSGVKAEQDKGKIDADKDDRVQKYEVDSQKTDVQWKHQKNGEHKTEKYNFENAKGNVLKTKIEVKRVETTQSNEKPEHKVVHHHKKQPEPFVRYNRGYVKRFLQNPDKNHQKTFRAHVEAVKAQHNVYRANHHLEKAERRVVHHQKRVEYALKNEHKSPRHIDRAVSKVERALKQVPKAHRNLEKAQKDAVKTAKNVPNQSFE